MRLYKVSERERVSNQLTDNQKNRLLEIVQLAMLKSSLEDSAKTHVPADKFIKDINPKSEIWSFSLLRSPGRILYQLCDRSAHPSGESPAIQA